MVRGLQGAFPHGKWQQVLPVDRYRRALALPARVRRNRSAGWPTGASIRRFRSTACPPRSAPTMVRPSLRWVLVGSRRCSESSTSSSSSTTRSVLMRRSGSKRLRANSFFHLVDTHDHSCDWRHILGTRSCASTEAASFVGETSASSSAPHLPTKISSSATRRALARCFRTALDRLARRHPSAPFHRHNRPNGEPSRTGNLQRSVRDVPCSGQALVAHLAQQCITERHRRTARRAENATRHSVRAVTSPYVSTPS